MSNLTAQDYLKWLVVLAAVRFSYIDISVAEHSGEELTSEFISQCYDQLEENGQHWDMLEEVRDSVNSVETNLAPTTSSRHYDIDVHAVQAHDGTWVAFNYLSGGGKFGDPANDYDWLKNAWLVDCREEPIQTIKRTFTNKSVVASV